MDAVGEEFLDLHDQALVLLVVLLRALRQQVLEIDLGHFLLLCDLEGNHRLVLDLSLLGQNILCLRPLDSPLLLEARVGAGGFGDARGSDGGKTIAAHAMRSVALALPIAGCLARSERGACFAISGSAEHHLMLFMLGWILIIICSCRGDR